MTSLYLHHISYLERIQSLKLSERQKKIVEIVKVQQPLSGEKISDLLDISRATLRADLSFLTLVGILKATPKNWIYILRFRSRKAFLFRYLSKRSSGYHDLSCLGIP